MPNTSAATREPQRIDKCQIPWCNAPISGPEHFRDDLSRKEFHITGMCQKCQDEVFEGKEP